MKGYFIQRRMPRDQRRHVCPTPLVSWFRLRYGSGALWRCDCRQAWSFDPDCEGGCFWTTYGPKSESSDSA